MNCLLLGKKLSFIIITAAWLADPIFAQDLIFPYSVDGKIGYRDSASQVLIEPQFDYAEEFTGGFPWTVVGIGDYKLLNHNMDHRQVDFSGKFGLISRDGSIVFRPAFTVILQLDREYAIVGNGSGYIHFEDFPDEKNLVFEGDLGVVGIRGDTIVPVKYTTLQSLNSGGNTYWFAIKQDSSYLYSMGMKLIIPEKILSVSNFSNGLARVKTTEGYGYMDTSGRMNLAPQFDKASEFLNGRALVKKNGKYYHLDTLGEKMEANCISFDEMSLFSEGFARVRVFDEFGFINPDSSFFIMPEFTEAGSFFNGIAPVSTIDSFGYIHTSGQRDLALKYQKNSIRAGGIRRNQPVILDSLKAVPCDCNDSAVLNVSFDTLSLSNFIALQLEATRWGPYLYYRYPQMLDKVSAGEGTLAGRFALNFDFLQPKNPVWENFRHKVLFPLIRNSKLHPLIWDWLKPFYKQVFMTMPEQHREVYLRLIDYLSVYFEDYQAEEVQRFLKDYPEEFAYRHWDGSQSSFRKVSAMFERLVYIHELLEVEEVKYWIRKVSREIKSW
ncbi:MAG: WG repeat-containing protein [Cyclobacteriaceae bacterium]|nr:WG repeat-containing protein [Cyclobacteriaceae bacterium]